MDVIDIQLVGAARSCAGHDSMRAPELLVANDIGSPATPWTTSTPSAPVHRSPTWQTPWGLFVDSLQPWPHHHNGDHRVGNLT